MRYGLRLLRVRRPRGATKADVEAIRPIDRVFNIGVADHWKDRPKLLFVDNAHAIGHVRDDRDGIEKAGPAGRFAADEDSRAVALGVFNQVHDLVVLHLVLNRSEYATVV